MGDAIGSMESILDESAGGRYATGCRDPRAPEARVDARDGMYRFHKSAVKS